MSGRRRCHGEEGAALVLALVFITVIGLLIGFVLTFVETSFKYSAVARTNRDELYAADGAMEAAIARLQASGRCVDQATMTTNGVGVDVTCESAPRPPPPPIEPAPSPPHAILTLGTSPVEGFHQVTGSGPISVRGDVFSHSVVANESSSRLQVQGEVSAVGNCTGDIQASVSPLKCLNKPGGAADPGDARDLGYPSDLTAVPARRPAPTCPADHWLVTLVPGYYDDALGLTRLTNGACRGKVVWFQPGVYYFDFNFASTDRTCAGLTNPCLWEITDPSINVVGGAPRGWSELDSPTSRPTVEFPGGCLTDAPGVQLVFGGQSRLAQRAGKVELCPRPNGDDPPITVYGLTAGVPSPAETVTLPASAAENGVPGYLSPDNARAVDERPARLTADAALSNATPVGPTSASLTVRGFQGVPGGSRITALGLRATHRETGDIGALRAAVAIDGVPLTGSPFTVDRCREPVAYCDARLDLLARVPGDMRTTLTEKLPLMSVTYQASLAAGEAKVGTESLDGIVLEVTYVPPSLEALSGCLVQPYDPGRATPPSCALLKASDQGSLAIGGTVYAPTAAVDLDLKDVDAPVLNRGIIAASLRLKVVAEPSYFGPVVALPDVHAKRAVLALRPEDGEGVLQAAESGRVVIRGDVFSQSDIDNDSTAPMRVEGRIAAVGACTGLIEVHPPDETSIPDKRCQGSGPPAPAEGADPVFPPAAEIAPVRQTAPVTCGPAGVTLDPGYYDDAVALSRLTGGACSDRVVWLNPGVYYFDFNFASTGPACADDAALCTWAISDPKVKVVGGTRDPLVTEIPGACRADESPGVQLIFGGQSRLHLAAGEMELCPARSSRLAPPIALYGLTRGTGPEHATSFAADVVSNINFVNPDNAERINEEPVRRTADATSPAGATTAAITVEFDAEVPEGARFNGATIRVAHRESAVGGAQVVSVIDAEGRPLATQPVPDCTTFCEARIELPGVTSPTQLTGIRATYTATLAGLTNPTENLDGIELEVRYTPPAFRALSGCLTERPGCALVKTEPTSKLVVNGTVYAPTASLDLAHDTLSAPVVSDGIVAGTVRLNIRPSVCYTGPVIAHVDAQSPLSVAEPGYVLTACIRGTPVLRARVTIESRKAVVQSWSVLR